MVQNKVVSSVVWSVAKTWGGRLTSLLVFMVLTRLLDARAVGAVAFVSAILAVLVTMSEIGLAEYLIYREDSTLSRNQIFWFQMYLSLAVFGVALLAGPPVLEALGQSDAAQIFPYLCLLLPLSALTSVQDAIQRRELKFKDIAIRSLIGMVVGGIVGVGTALAGGGMWSLVAKQLSETIVIVALLWGMSDWRPRWSCDWSGFRKIFDYGRYLAGGRLLDILTINIDDVIVGIAIGQNELGLYSIGKKLYAMTSELLAGVAHQISGPLFAKLKEGKTTLWTMYVTAVGYISWLVIPLYTALYLLAPQIVPLLFGDKWSGAVWILQSFCFVGMVLPLWLFHWSMLMTSGSSAVTFKYSLVRNIGGIAIVGSAIYGGWQIFVLSQIARAVYCIAVGEFFLKRYLPYKRLTVWRSLIPGLATALAVVAATYLARTPNIQFLEFGAVMLVLGGSFSFLLKKILRSRK